MGPRKPPAAKDLCVYLVELDISVETGVQDETLQLVRHCVMDKIFSENPDHIAICRSDLISTVQFVQPNWDALRKVERIFGETKIPEKTRSCISALLSICDTLINQAEEDSYEAKKILFFGHLKGDEIEEKSVVRLAEMLKSNGISISLIFTDEDRMDEKQKRNLEIVNGVLEQKKYNKWAFVTSYKKARKQIMNTLTKKPTRPSPWSVVMEIGPNIKISVGGYVCTRKNKIGEMTRALMKVVPQQPLGQILALQGANESSATEPASEKTVVVEVAKTVTAKEVTWKEKDGNTVDEDDIGRGYLYGDKIVPFNELESENAYQSGEKCLKVIVFCPLSNIKPAYQMGDGTTLFYPKTNDVGSELKFDALLSALHNNNRVAIVRKVRLKNEKVKLGVLAPDMERMCLVFSEICFADDVSVPHFSTLIKEVPTEDEGITKQEELIDDLITAMSIDDFYPGDGPVDPALSIVRENVACRILDQGNGEKKPSGSIHGIDIFFDKVVLKDDLLAKLQESFPLKVNKEEADRPAGANIFRKRLRENDHIEGPDDEKKIKVEESDNTGAVTMEDNEVDVDDLLDQL